MQKVSKQSLAMLALSILLAISIALTFTFAGLTDQKTATGTITFNGNVAIELGSAFVSGTNLTIQADANGALTIPEEATIGLSASSVSAYLKVTVSALSGNNTPAATLASADEVNSGWADKTNNVYTSNAKLAAGGSVKLSELIKITIDLNQLVDDSNITFTITVDADATNGGNWA